MNEFEWRRQLRDLRQPRVPARDLWPAIAAALDSPTSTHAPAPQTRAMRPQRRRRWLLGAGLAASLLLACGAGWRWLQAAPDSATPATTSWKPADPRLAGGAIELDAARMELQLAIKQAPDSAALQRLLDLTERQQARLRQLANRAG